MISDPASSNHVQKSAAFSLRNLADPSSGPALLKALDLIIWSEALWQTVEAIEGIHYEPAAPKILSLLKRERQGKGYYIKALASLRYKPAIPEIEQFCKMKKFSADWLIDRQEQKWPASVWFTPTGISPEIALMRLTASWGAASDGIRLLLLAPEGSVTVGRTRLVLLIENCGDRALEVLGMCGGTLFLDGKPHEDKYPFGAFNGSMTLRVNEVAARVIDVSRLVGDRGIHQVEYQY